MKKYFAALLFLILAAPFTVMAQSGCCLRTERDPGGPLIQSCFNLSTREDCPFGASFHPETVCDRSNLRRQICAPPKEETKPLPFKQTPPTLKIDIPGFEKFSELPPRADAEGNIYIPFLGEYLAALYQYAIAIVGLVAAIFIIKGGFEYITSGGAADKVGRAKETISNALIALFLVLGSYTLFYFIDPELVQFKHLKIKVIKNEPIPDTDLGTDLGEEAEFIRPEARVEIVSNYIVNNIKDSSLPMLNPEAGRALLQAAEDFFGIEGEKIQINSGYRSWEQQEKYYQKNCGTLPCLRPTCKPLRKNGQPIANCPHTSLKAADLTCAGKSSRDPCQEKIKERLIQAGFCQLSSEAWHFEYPKLSPNCLR